MKKQCLMLFFLPLLFSTRLNAQMQESMMTEVSYVFLEKLIATAKENYPRVNAYKSKAAIAQSNLSMKKGNWLDGLSFSYIYQPKNTFNIVYPVLYNGYQLAFQFSPSSFFEKGGAVKQAKEGIKLVQSEEDEYNLTLETQVKSRYYTYIERLIILRLQNKAFADAQSLNKDINNKYLKKEVSLADYLQTQIALTNTLQTKVIAESSFMTAKAALEELLTKKIEEVQ